MDPGHLKARKVQSLETWTFEHYEHPLSIYSVVCPVLKINFSIFCIWGKASSLGRWGLREYGQRILKILIGGQRTVHSE
jgi:hypothetical protein